MKIKPRDFLELLHSEGIMYWIRNEHIVLSGTNDELISKLSVLLAKSKDFEAALIKFMNTINPLEFIHELQSYGLHYEIKNYRIQLIGGNDKVLARCRKTIAANPELEAKLILHEAMINPDLLDEIQERACIRWSEGYSDSLYMAVLSGLIDTEEKREFADTPDMKQVEFRRRMGTPEADIMDKQKCPSVWIKRNPRTDWKTELSTYKELLRV